MNEHTSLVTPRVYFDFHTVAHRPVILFSIIIHFPLGMSSTPTLYLLNSIRSTTSLFMNSSPVLLQFLYTHEGQSAVESSSRRPWDSELEIAKTQMYPRSVLTENTDNPAACQ